MNVEILTLCEDVQRREDGAYILVNPFDAFRPATVPYTHAKCFVFGKIRFNKAGTYYLKAKLVDQNNKAVSLLFQGPIELDDSPHHSGSASFPYRLNNLTFERFGKYSIVLFVDDRKLFSVPCFVAPPSLKLPSPN